jgi:twinkle protein
VVHPTKIQKNKDGTRPVPTPYDISGSAHWYNKADNIITVHREQGTESQDVEIHVQKVRFKHIGHTGLAKLKYDKVTGRYFDLGHSGVPGDLYADPERGQPPPAPIVPPRAREPGEEG